VSQLSHITGIMSQTHIITYYQPGVISVELYHYANGQEKPFQACTVQAIKPGKFRSSHAYFETQAKAQRFAIGKVEKVSGCKALMKTR